MIRFYVPSKPQGKARARTFYNKSLGRMQSMTPDKTVLYENNIIHSFIKSAGEERELLQGPVQICIAAYYPVPKSTARKVREQIGEGKILPTKKPDADNIAKVVCDALNQIAYGDDAQIVRLIVTKHFEDKENPVGLVVEVGEYGTWQEMEIWQDQEKKE